MEELLIEPGNGIIKFWHWNFYKGEGQVTILGKGLKNGDTDVLNLKQLRAIADELSKCVSALEALQHNVSTDIEDMYSDI